MAKNDFQYGGWNSYTLQCGTWLWDHDSVNSPSGSKPTLQRETWLWDDMSLNSPGSSTLQCGRWLWDNMTLNSPKRPPYWNSTFGFDFDHITAVDMSFYTSLRNFIQIGPPSAEKNNFPPSWILEVQ